jgi:hypothetical protein
MVIGECIGMDVAIDYWKRIPLEFNIGCPNLKMWTWARYCVCIGCLANDFNFDWVGPATYVVLILGINGS